MKRKLFFFAIVVLVLLVLLASLLGGKKALKPGKYEVTQAVFEQKDQDYELEVRGHGEYDVKQLQVVTNSSQSGMLLEIKPSGEHLLHVKSEQDIIIEEESSSLFKKKKKRK